MPEQGTKPQQGTALMGVDPATGVAYFLAVDPATNKLLISGTSGGGAATIADGADVTQGTIADPASSAGGAGTLSAKTRLMTTQLGTINTTLGSPLQAGGTVNIGTAPTIVVAGPTPDGSAASTNPVLISGTTDGTATGLIAVPKVTAGGVLSVDGSASTQPISAASLPLPSGAATSAAQTTMATNQTAVQAPVAPGAATATKSELIGGQYNSTQATFTDGQQGSLQISSRGEVKTVINDAAGNARGANVDSSNRLAVLATVSGTLSVQGTLGDANVVGGNAVATLYEGRTTNKTAVTTGQYVRPIATSIGAAVNKPFQVPELDWSYPAAAGGISNTTTAVTMVGAAGAGIRNYLTAIQVSAGALGAASEIAVRDGAGGTVIWRGFISTAGGNQSVNLSSPIKSTANTLLEVVTLTATITGAVYINAQGYQAP